MVNRNCALAMTRCWPIPRHRPISLWRIRVSFLWPASRPVTARRSLRAASSRFHPTSGAGGSTSHCEDAISTTAGHYARDVRRKVELWLDPAALHTLWDRTWNQWKHLLGTKIEVEGTFVQSGKYRKTTWGVGTCNLGGCIAEPPGGQSACRSAAAVGHCPYYLPPLWSSTRRLWIDPAVLGTSGRRASGAGAHVCRATSSR